MCRAAPSAADVAIVLLPRALPLFCLHQLGGACGHRHLIPLPLTFPLSVFVLQCTAPLLSSIRWAEDADVLVPPFGPRYEPHWVPWEQKSDTAFFR